MLGHCLILGVRSFGSPHPLCPPGPCKPFWLYTQAGDILIKPILDILWDCLNTIFSPLPTPWSHTSKLQTNDPPCNHHHCHQDGHDDHLKVFFILLADVAVPLVPGVRSVLLSSPAADTINIDVADPGHDHDVGVCKGDYLVWWSLWWWRLWWSHGDDDDCDVDDDESSFG